MYCIKELVTYGKIEVQRAEKRRKKDKCKKKMRRVEKIQKWTRRVLWILD